MKQYFDDNRALTNAVSLGYDLWTGFESQQHAIHRGHTPECSLIFQHLNDVLCQRFFYLAMTRNGLTNPCLWILVPIMSSTATNKDASTVFNSADEIAAFHES